MNAAAAAGVGLLAGFVVGLVFFAALLWTTDRLVVSERPGVLLVSSTLVRMAVAGLAFVVIAQMGAAGLVAALVGFVAARVVVVRRSGAALDRAAVHRGVGRRATAIDRDGGG